MQNILSRIQAFVAQESITIGALEKKIGASKGVLSRAIKNDTDIQAKWLSIIVENYPLLSGTWLLTGKGNMYKETNATSNDPAIEIYKDMIKAKDDLIQQQKEMIEQLKGMIDQQNDMIDRLHHEILNGGQSACDATDETAALAG